MALETAIALVVGFAIKEIASGALKEVGKEYLFKPITNLLTPDEIIQLNLFSDIPDSPSLQEKATKILETRLTENPQVANEVAELIKKFTNTANITNEAITNNSEVSNKVSQDTQSSANNEATITNKNIDNSKVTNEVTQK